MTVFTCATCGEAKPKAEFYVRRKAFQDSEKRSHFSAKCKLCYNAEQSAYKRERRKDPEHRKRERARVLKNLAANPEKYAAIAKNGRLNFDYGITLKEYKQMLEDQNGVCLICGRPETRLWKGKPTHMCVDHCHKTGRVRALLCQKCNSAVALVLECPDVAARLAWYVTCMC